MKRILVIAVLIIAAAFLALGQTSGKKAGQSGNAEKAVRQLVEELTNAQMKNDAAALDRLWAEDYIFTNPWGVVQNKAQRLAEFKSGDLKFSSFSTDDVQVRVYGDTAVVTNRATVKAQRQGQEVSGQYRGTSVYVKRQGRWQQVAGQATRIGP